MSGKFYTFHFIATSSNRVIADRVEVSAYSLCHAEMLAERVIQETKLRGMLVDKLTLSLDKVVKI
jgi:hypothetical protein